MAFFSLAELAAQHDLELRGSNKARITGVATLSHARSNQLSFFTNPRYRADLLTTQAAAVILSPKDAPDCPTTALISTNPLLSYAHIARLFQPATETKSGIHPGAVVSSEAQIADSAWIGPHCTIERGVVIEAGVYLGSGCVVAEHARIGRDSRLLANIYVGHDVILGQRVLVYPGVVLGSDGFGMAVDYEQGGRFVKIPQLGSVRIGNDVEIGANTTIDRGAIEDTVIEEGVKLDNLIQVAHNVQIGAHSALAGCVGIAGSAKIGKHCLLGGGVGISGHLELTDRVTITGMSLVTQSITEAGTYSSGLTVEPNRLWNKISARLRRLDDLARRVIKLEKQQQQLQEPERGRK